MSAGEFGVLQGHDYVLEHSDEITDLLLDATLLAETLKAEGRPTDCLIGHIVEARRSIFRKKEPMLEYAEGWDMHGCEPAGIRALALSTDGRIYLNSVDPMYGDADQMLVMPLGYELGESHFYTFARVDELGGRLEDLSTRHGLS
jgi:hypothetical protein